MLDPRCTFQNIIHVQGREPLFVPCTPLGCIELLERTNTPIAGRRAAVIGRSNIVGMPVALLLIKRNATVTLCHSATQNMEQVVREADIVIAAAGQAEMIKVSLPFFLEQTAVC
jgi:5,10-methylene-tetrahydrofolate dehydrogenase/methenyl tetrahydrofolate cyclohydrolase